MEKEKIEKVARAVHEINRLYCIALGDNSQKPWGRAPAWQKNSAIDGILDVIENPSMTAKEQHENWMAGKRLSGWKWGPVKNETKKEHPCMVDYDELPVEQRAKDTIFGAVVRGLLGLG